MVCDRCNYFLFGLFFAHFPSNNPKNQDLKKNEKKAGRYHFTYMYQKLWSDNIQFLRHGVRRMDGQMDSKSDIEVGVPPKKPTDDLLTISITFTWFYKIENIVM